jgi:hypothetical protein
MKGQHVQPLLKPTVFPGMGERQHAQRVRRRTYDGGKGRPEKDLCKNVPRRLTKPAGLVQLPPPRLWSILSAICRRCVGRFVLAA